MAQSRRMKIGKAVGVKQPFGHTPGAVPQSVTGDPNVGQVAPMNIQTQKPYVGRRMPTTADFATRLGEALGGTNG